MSNLDSNLPRYMRSTVSSRTRSERQITPAGPAPALITHIPPPLLMPEVVEMSKMVYQLPILEDAASTLTRDIDIFLRERLYIPQRPIAEDFVSAATYYSKTLIHGALNQLYTVNNLPPDLARQRETTRLVEARMLADLDSMRDALEDAGWDFEWPTTSSEIPTTSPYQCLHQALLERLDLDVVGNMEQARTLLLSLEHRLNLLLANNQGTTTTRHYGHPKTCFVSIYPIDNQKYRLLFGCTQPDWGRYKEISTVTRAVRTTRLQQVVPFAGQAFRQLAELDEKLYTSVENRTNDSRERRALKKKGRQDIILAMRNDDAFLGGLHELGVAYRGTDWAMVQACYQCAATMGYQAPKTWTRQEREDYHYQFPMANRKRDSNPHACAETEGRLQSFNCNMRHGRPLKW